MMCGVYVFACVWCVGVCVHGVWECECVCMCGVCMCHVG